MINPLPAMGYKASMPSAAAPAPQVMGRGRSSLKRTIIALSWLVGITGSFLTVGVIGMFARDLPPIHLKTLEDLEAAIEMPMEDAPMGELVATEASADQAAQTDPVLPVEIPEAVETPPENLDLPEIAEAMTMKDVFAVPTAPKIENALRPIDPVLKPKATPNARTTAAPTGGGTRAGATPGGGGGGSGTGGGGGKFYRPQPNYPEFARSAGMQGTVRLSITVGPSGTIESVNVIGTTGFSALDEHAAAFVRRNWKAPPGRYTAPLTFRLR